MRLAFTERGIHTNSGGAIIQKVDFPTLGENFQLEMSETQENNEDEDDSIHLQFKVILLGDGAVGKTSIATRFADDQFNQKYKQTGYKSLTSIHSCHHCTNSWRGFLHEKIGTSS